MLQEKFLAGLELNDKIKELEFNIQRCRQAIERARMFDDSELKEFSQFLSGGQVIDIDSDVAQRVLELLQAIFEQKLKTLKKEFADL